MKYKTVKITRNLKDYTHNSRVMDVVSFWYVYLYTDKQNISNSNTIKLRTNIVLCLTVDYCTIFPIGCTRSAPAGLLLFPHWWHHNLAQHYHSCPNPDFIWRSCHFSDFNKHHLRFKNDFFPNSWVWSSTSFLFDVKCERHTGEDDFD